jgi:dTDP-4-dehydrorhamnose reductase
MDDSQGKILITGASGQLGDALLRRLGERAIGCTRAEWDLGHAEGAELLVAKHRPAAVVNCAAYTQVDKAESEPELCFAINQTAVEQLAAACDWHGARLVQISTDYIFGGESLGRPWKETDTPEPESVYARSKLAGEAAAQICSQHLIVRTCGLYGGGPTRVSFVEKMLQLAQTRKQLRIVNDQRCTPSLVDDVAAAIEFLLDQQASGIYHVVNAGDVTWIDFAAEIFRLAGIEMELESITTAQFGAPAARPSYSVLDTAKYRELEERCFRGAKGDYVPTLRTWQAALADYLGRRLKI